MTDTPSPPPRLGPLVQAVWKFSKRLQDELGLSTEEVMKLFKFSADFIDREQEMMDRHGLNKGLLPRLNGTGLKEGELTFPQVIEKLTKPSEKPISDAAAKYMLDEFANIRRSGEKISLFADIERALANITQDSRGALRGGLHGMDEEGDVKGPNIEGFKPSGGWRDSLKGDRPPISKDDIARSAREHDASFGGPSEADIKHSANESNSYREGGGPDNEFDKTKRDDEGEQHFEHLGDTMQTGEHAFTLIKLIHKIYDETIGAQLAASASAAKAL